MSIITSFTVLSPEAQAVYDALVERMDALDCSDLEQRQIESALDHVHHASLALSELLKGAARRHLSHS